MNWPLVAGAGVLTLLVLGGLGAAAWAIINPAAKKNDPPAVANPPAPTAPRAVAEKAGAPVPAEPRPELLAAAEPIVPEPEITAPPEPRPAAKAFEPEPSPPACESYGTSVQFLGNQAEAARTALKDKKLLFVLHISGNFEDSRFTWNNAEALRVNALANKEVGKYLNAHFVSSFQKVGTFQVQGNQKQGGNVASYFCTPGGRVLHVIAGPVDAATLLREARWVMETQKLALLESQGDAARFREIFRQAHAGRLRQEHGLNIGLNGLTARTNSAAAVTAVLARAGQNGKLNNQGRVHLLLTAAPLPRIEQIYKVVFEQILGEKISTNPVARS